MSIVEIKTGVQFLLIRKIIQMKNKIQQKFKKVYNLELLIVSAEDYQVGWVVEYDNGKLDVENYPFISEILEDESKQKEITELIKLIPFVSANLAEYKIDKSFGLAGGIPIPNIGLNISAGFAGKSVQNFSFENITKKSISGDLKVKLKKIIKEAKINDKKHYRKELKNLHIFDELYYAESIVFEVENTTKADIDANLKKLNLEPKVKHHSGSKYIVEIAGNKLCPFAAKIEPLKDYIDDARR